MTVVEEAELTYKSHLIVKFHFRTMIKAYKTDWIVSN